MNQHRWMDYRWDGEFTSPMPVDGCIIRIQQQYRIMMLMLAALLLCLPRCGQPRKMYAAIQTQQQLYFSYLPFVKSCDYNDIDVQPTDINVTTFNASVTIKLLDAHTFFNEIYFEDIMTFWSPVRNGLSIMMVLPEQFGTATGYIFYASKVSNFNRQLILYSINNTNTTSDRYLTFYYTLNTISVSNMSLNVQVVQEQPIQLTPQAIQIIQQCPNTTATNFAYIGNETFLYVCGQLATGFTFAPAHNFTVNILDFSTKIGYGAYEIAANPLMINNPGFRDQFYWNCGLYFSNQTFTQIYFITYNFEHNNFTLLSFTSMEPQVNLLINRIWGLQVKKQISRWMDLFASFNITSDVNFPGEIVSVFISTHENIFVESADGSLNYLCIFDNSGGLIENISYAGTIVYYGSKDVFIYNEPTDQLYQVIVDRPIFVLQFPNTFQPDTYSSMNITMTCDNHEEVLDYQILWTSFNYPSALIVPIDESPIITTNYIYGFQVTDRFLVIGPDFQLVVNAQPSIQVIIIDSSTIIINKQAISIVNVQIYNGNFATVVFATNSGIYSINNRRELQTLSSEPCGFDNIASVVKSGPDSYLVTNLANQQCSCSLDFTDCHIVSQNTAYLMLTSSSYMYENNSPYMNYLNAMRNNVGGGPQPMLVKKNIYTLVREGYVVSILSNNTILLINIRTKSVADTALMSTCSYNATNGGIYIREFYDPFLILYCQQSTQLTQFIIRQGQIIYERRIPLYRFSTRSSDNAFFPGFTFVFISVDPTIEVYPQPENCCVLRLDPCQYTVSVIAQIINAQSIIMVTKYRNIDIALFKSTNIQNYQCIIKAYFPHIWVTLNQTNNSQVTTDEPQKIQVIFESPRYNFAASFNLSVTFNLTGANLILNQSERPQLSQFGLYTNITKHGNPQLEGSNNYSFTQLICGPIFRSFFYRAAENMSNVEIIQNSVLTKTKILGNIGIQFIQIINPSKFSVSDLSLNFLILVVSVDKMFVYDKQLDGVQMAAIKNFTLPEKRCTYYLYEVINQTAATLTSNCEGINYNFRSPLLTINYEPINGTFTSSYEWTVIPMALRQIYTVVRPNNQSTLVIGLLQGPMNAATGKLYICDGMLCSPLYVSSRFVFLINYAAHVADDDLYVVMSIDCFTIQVFMNPQVQPNGEIIDSNYTFNYTQYVEQNYCSVIKMLNSTFTKAFCILSCSQYYYYIIMEYATQSITILKRFVRYSQCDMEDVFKPYVVYANNSDVAVLLAPCRQNDYTFRLQAYQTINSSAPIIFTGYLQIYTMSGPLGPNCLPDTLSPIKIISLSTSMNYPLFMTYSINGIQKFIYSEINGILIDNYVESELFLQVRYEPITIQFNYPEINLFIVNPFHYIVLKIITEPISNSFGLIRFVNCFVFAIFVAANLITLTCLACYVSQKKQKNLLLQMQMRESSGGTSNVGHQLEYEDPLKNINITLEKQRQRKTTLTKRNPNRPSQIQMYFVKRK